MLSVELTGERGAGGGGAKLNSLSERQPGPLYIVQYSLQYMLGTPETRNFVEDQPWVGFSSVAGERLF